MANIFWTTLLAMCWTLCVFYFDVVTLNFYFKTDLNYGAIITLSDIIYSLINQHAQFSILNSIQQQLLVCIVWFKITFRQRENIHAYSTPEDNACQQHISLYT